METDAGEVQITIEPSPAADDLQRVAQGLTEHALAAGVEPRRHARLAVLARDGAGALVGGLDATMVWGWLQVAELWVAPSWRGRGVGRRLLLAAEAEARRHGCHHALLDTFDFQAPGFYDRLGYTTWSQLADFPRGHVRSFLRKSLEGAASAGTLTQEDLVRLGAAGIYDDDAADAAAQRSVLELLVQNGVAPDEILAAHRLGDLVMRGFEHLIRPGALRTEGEAAAAAGLDAAQARRVWRAWGFPDPHPGERCWTDGDVATLKLFAAMSAVAGEKLALHGARAMGTAMSRIAEAEIALIRSRIEAPLNESHVAVASILTRYRFIVASLLPATAAGMDALHRAHLVHLGRRYSGSAGAPSTHNVVDLVVGFADLTGSTALVQQLDLAGLDRALAAFEERTSDLIAASGASLVKRLGDGVMFVATDAAAACRLALDLVDAFAPPWPGPPVRVGLACGTVAALRGDFFGPAVHQAARIVAAAPAGAAVATRDVCLRAPAVATAPLGAASLAGFAEPVELLRLVR